MGLHMSVYLEVRSVNDDVVDAGAADLCEVTGNDCAVGTAVVPILKSGGAAVHLACHVPDLWLSPPVELAHRAI